MRKNAVQHPKTTNRPRHCQAAEHAPAERCFHRMLHRQGRPFSVTYTRLPFVVILAAVLVCLVLLVVILQAAPARIVRNLSMPKTLPSLPIRGPR